MQTSYLIYIDSCFSVTVDAFLDFSYVDDTRVDTDCHSRTKIPVVVLVWWGRHWIEKRPCVAEEPPALFFSLEPCLQTEPRDKGSGKRTLSLQPRSNGDIQLSLAVRNPFEGFFPSGTRATMVAVVVLSQARPSIIVLGAIRIRPLPATSPSFLALVRTSETVC